MEIYNAIEFLQKGTLPNNNNTAKNCSLHVFELSCDKSDSQCTTKCIINGDKQTDYCNYKCINYCVRIRNDNSHILTDGKST